MLDVSGTTAATGSWSMIPLIRESQHVSESLKYSEGVFTMGLNVCLAFNSVNSATMFVRVSMMSGKSFCTAASAVSHVFDGTVTFLLWTSAFLARLAFLPAQPPEHSASEPKM